MRCDHFFSIGFLPRDLGIWMAWMDHYAGCKDPEGPDGTPSTPKCLCQSWEVMFFQCAWKKMMKDMYQAKKQIKTESSSCKNHLRVFFCCFFLGLPWFFVCKLFICKFFISNSSFPGSSWYCLTVHFGALAQWKWNSNWLSHSPG